MLNLQTCNQSDFYHTSKHTEYLLMMLADIANDETTSAPIKLVRILEIIIDLNEHVQKYNLPFNVALFVKDFYASGCENYFWWNWHSNKYFIEA